jgi:hypothetical protein
MDQIRAEQEQIRGYLLSAYRPDDARFREVCPSVIVRKDQRSFWTLPSDYRETVIDDEFSAWRSDSEK